VTDVIRPSEPLAEEIKAVRRGAGLHHRTIADRVGPELRRVCEITEGDTLSVVRTKLIERLGRAANELPEELAVSVRAALGIQPETERMLQLQNRVDWLARRLHRDVRTARRRVDEACTRLAEVLAAGSAARAARRGPGWYVADFHAVALLDRADPMTIERREIVSDQDGLGEITLGFSLRDTGSPTGIGLRVLYGGQLAEPEAASESRMRVVLRLPHPLREDERHEYSVMTTLPPTLAMQRHYAYTPATRCDRFHLRVRFDPERAPARIWRVAEAFHRDLDERVLDGEALHPDACGDLQTSFEDLLPGYGYGIQWT
jgi:hypothetical protein